MWVKLTPTNERVRILLFVIPVRAWDAQATQGPPFAFWMSFVLAFLTPCWRRARSFPGSSLPLFCWFNASALLTAAGEAVAAGAVTTSLRGAALGAAALRSGSAAGCKSQLKVCRHKARRCAGEAAEADDGPC